MQARAAIRSYLRNFKKQEAVALRRLLEKEFNAHNMSFEDVRRAYRPTAKALELPSLEALLKISG